MTREQYLSPPNVAFSVLFFISGFLTANITSVESWSTIVSTIELPKVQLDLSRRSASEATKSLGSVLNQPILWLLFVTVIGLICFYVLRFKPEKLSLAPQSTTATSRLNTSESAEKLDSNWKIQRELNEVVHLVSDYLGVNDRFAQMIVKKNRQLSDKSQPKHIKEVVQSLILENKKFQEETRKLNECLAKSKEQLDSLRADLTEAQQESLRDALTSIGNRRLFDMALADEIGRAQKTSNKLSLVMTDIDHFKSFNDEYGHLIGDEVLKIMAQLIKSNIKGRDIVARYGGEEFALILPNTDTEDAVVLADQIRCEIEKKELKINNTGQLLRKITASFGIATYRKGEDREGLIKRADSKLYEAKSSGRNCVKKDIG
ncbi:MAG: GGDEF domain-containing protein [Hyphomicrobiaceae bacterium]